MTWAVMAWPTVSRAVASVAVVDGRVDLWVGLRIRLPGGVARSGLWRATG
jgi:hypothetical protein